MTTQTDRLRPYLAQLEAVIDALPGGFLKEIAQSNLTKVLEIVGHQPDTPPLPASVMRFSTDALSLAEAHPFHALIGRVDDEGVYGVSTDPACPMCQTEYVDSGKEQ